MRVLIENREAGGLLHLILNEPRKKNALTDDLRAALRAAVVAAQDDPTVRAIVLSGAEGSFSSGGDIQAMTDDPVLARQRMTILHEVVRLFMMGRKPVVAAVSGPAFGGGFSLALCCDQVIADTTARFSASFGRVGLPPDLALSFNLPRRAGAGAARRILLSCAIVEAPEAARLGIADFMVEPQSLLQEAFDRAREMAAHGQEAKAYVKTLLTQGAGDLDRLLENEMQAYLTLLTSPEHRAARAAFLSRSGA